MVEKENPLRCANDLGAGRVFPFWKLRQEENDQGDGSVTDDWLVRWNAAG